MRLIDANEVLNGIEELKTSPWATEFYMFPHQLAVKEAMEVVSELCVNQSPTIDAVPVVRCKDCLMFIPDKQLNHDDYPNQICADGLCSDCDKYKDESDFCSNGERKGEIDCGK